MLKLALRRVPQAVLARSAALPLVAKRTVVQLPSSVTRHVPNRPPYKGPLKACILDWSGTTCDAHVIAPAVAFVEVFKKYGVPISMKEAREPMGLRKDLHIAKILETSAVRERWQKAKGKAPTQADVDMMYKDFVPMQLKVLPQYAPLIPGTAETVRRLKSEFKLKIGSTTGFSRSMVNVLLEHTKKQGYEPDTTVAGDEVPHNMGFRPAPFMVYQNLVQLGVFPIEAVVKVDDTVTGVGEGLNAGCWTVGLSRYSNYTDIDTMEQWERMSDKEKNERASRSREKLNQSGAHYVADSMADLPAIVDDINQRLAYGERP